MSATTDGSDRDSLLGHLLVLLLAVPPVIAFRGFVLSKLWLWFVVPLGAPRVFTLQAVGLSLLVGVVTYVPAKRDETTWVDTLGACLGSAIVSGLALGIGAALDAFR